MDILSAQKTSHNTANMEIDGQIYGIATINGMEAYQFGYEYKSDLADRLGINMANVKTMDDLECIFQQIKQKAPGIYPVSGEPSLPIDTLGNSLGVLMDYGQSEQVIDLYSTPDFEELIRRIYLWRQQGWMLPDDGNTLRNISILRSDMAFGSFRWINLESAVEESRSVGEKINVISLSKPFLSSNLNQSFWAVTKRCEYPDLAMRFLDLLYSDQKVINLLDYGIEGVHYRRIEQNIIDFPKGITARNSGYSQFMTWLYGDSRLAYIWNGLDTPIRNPHSSSSSCHSLPPTPSRIIWRKFLTSGNIMPRMT